MIAAAEPVTSQAVPSATAELCCGIDGADPVILAPGRVGRPQLMGDGAAAATCPFCVGNEARTAELARYPADGAWRVRVVANAYPLASAGVPGDTRIGAPWRVPNRGRHEVIIEDDRHQATWSDMETAHVALILTVWQERVRGLFGDTAAKAVIAFKNSGVAAGGTIAHPHSQLISLNFEPPVLRARRLAKGTWRRRHGGCAICAAVAEALRAPRTAIGAYTLIEQRGPFAAVRPIVTRHDWQIDIIPLAHGQRFPALVNDEIGALATLIQSALRRLECILGRYAYNVLLAIGRTAPHWRVEIVPRTSLATGFELATGLTVLTVSPETAIARLRAAPA